MHLAAMVADSVGKYEDKPALFFGDQILTYRELWEHAGQVKNHLLQREGIAPGDRVALWMGNIRVHHSPNRDSTIRSGCRPLNHFLTPPEADGILKDAQTTVVFSDADRIEARSSMPHWKRNLMVGQNWPWAFLRKSSLSMPTMPIIRLKPMILLS